MRTTRSTLLPSPRWVTGAVLALLASLAAAQATGPGARLAEADTDGDGLLSKEEFIATGARAEAFDRLDANSDGMLDTDELGAPRQRPRGRRSAADRFAAIDTDGDGLISSAEFAALPSAPPVSFEELDANADGYLDEEEKAAIRQRARERLRAREPAS